jgi:hypothetical protein
MEDVSAPSIAVLGRARRRPAAQLLRLPLTAMNRVTKKSFRARDSPSYNAEKPMRTLDVNASRTTQQDRQVPAGGRGQACCE